MDLQIAEKGNFVLVMILGRDVFQCLCLRCPVYMIDLVAATSRFMLEIQV